MDYLHAVYLAVVQGVSEFLPVSSYGHLVLFPRLFGWPDQGLAFDIAVHVGSLVAVVSYFRRDVLKLCRGALAPLRGREQSPHGRLAWSVAAATIPAVLAGLAFGDFIEARLRQPQVIAATTVVFGLLMWWADARGLDPEPGGRSPCTTRAAAPRAHGPRSRRPPRRSSPGGTGASRTCEIGRAHV